MGHAWSDALTGLRRGVWTAPMTTDLVPDNRSPLEQRTSLNSALPRIWIAHSMACDPELAPLEQLQRKHSTRSDLLKHFSLEGYFAHHFLHSNQATDIECAPAFHTRSILFDGWDDPPFRLPSISPSTKGEVDPSRPPDLDGFSGFASNGFFGPLPRSKFCNYRPLQTFGPDEVLLLHRTNPWVPVMVTLQRSIPSSVLANVSKARRLYHGALSQCRPKANDSRFVVIRALTRLFSFPIDV